LSDAVTQGQFRQFLTRSHFVPKGKKQNRYVGILEGKPHIITFHYHKDNDIIPSGTLSAMAKQLELSKKDLLELIKNR
jgi:hypothetical protein